jgi:hypothetical protein
VRFNAEKLMRSLLLPIFLVAALATGARAEIIQLLDNTQLNAKILHYYDGVFHLETAGGEKVELPVAKIKSITFKLPPPRAEFSTPEKTFARYKDALVKSDFNKVIDCYALMYQGMLAAQLGQSGDELKKMQRDIEGMKFEIKGSKVSGSTATLKVQRSKGEDVETAEIRLVLENGEWKMTP